MRRAGAWLLLAAIVGLLVAAGHATYALGRDEGWAVGVLFGSLVVGFCGWMALSFDRKTSTREDQR